MHTEYFEVVVTNYINENSHVTHLNVIKGCNMVIIKGNILYDQPISWILL